MVMIVPLQSQELMWQKHEFRFFVGQVHELISISILTISSTRARCC